MSRDDTPFAARRQRRLQPSGLSGLPPAWQRRNPVELSPQASLQAQPANTLAALRAALTAVDETLPAMAQVARNRNATLDWLLYSPPDAVKRALAASDKVWKVGEFAWLQEEAQPRRGISTSLPFSLSRLPAPRLALERADLLLWFVRRALVWNANVADRYRWVGRRRYGPLPEQVQRDLKLRKLLQEGWQQYRVLCAPGGLLTSYAEAPTLGDPTTPLWDAFQIIVPQGPLRELGEMGLIYLFDEGINLWQPYNLSQEDVAKGVLELVRVRLTTLGNMNDEQQARIIQAAQSVKLLEPPQSSQSSQSSAEASATPAPLDAVGPGGWSAGVVPAYGNKGNEGEGGAPFEVEASQVTIMLKADPVATATTATVNVDVTPLVNSVTGDDFTGPETPGYLIGSIPAANAPVQEYFDGAAAWQDMRTLNPSNPADMTVDKVRAALREDIREARRTGALTAREAGELGLTLGAQLGLIAEVADTLPNGELPRLLSRLYTEGRAHTFALPEKMGQWALAAAQDVGRRMVKLTARQQLTYEPMGVTFRLGRDGNLVYRYQRVLVRRDDAYEALLLLPPVPFEVGQPVQDALTYYVENVQTKPSEAPRWLRKYLAEQTISRTIYASVQNPGIVPVPGMVAAALGSRLPSLWRLGEDEPMPGPLPGPTKR